MCQDIELGYCYVKKIKPERKLNISIPEEMFGIKIKVLQHVLKILDIEIEGQQSFFSQGLSYII